MNGDITIAISDLRRKFGDIEESLPYVDHFILTKKGIPFAILSATPQVKKGLMRKLAGALQESSKGDEKIWSEVLKRKSRKQNISL